MIAVPKSPRAPAGRSIELKYSLAEIVEKVSRAELGVGDEVGVCAPLCGPITIKLSSSTATNAGKKYASCQAHSDAAHKCFFWCEGVVKPEGRALFPEEVKVPHAVWRGLLNLVVWANGLHIHFPQMVRT